MEGVVLADVATSHLQEIANAAKGAYIQLVDEAARPGVYVDPEAITRQMNMYMEEMRVRARQILRDASGAANLELERADELLEMITYVVRRAGHGGTRLMDAVRTIPGAELREEDPERFRPTHDVQGLASVRVLYVPVEWFSGGARASMNAFLSTKANGLGISRERTKELFADAGSASGVVFEAVESAWQLAVVRTGTEAMRTVWWGINLFRPGSLQGVIAGGVCACLLVASDWYAPNLCLQKHLSDTLGFAFGWIMP